MVWSIALRGRAPESMALAQELLNSVRLPDVVAIVNAPLDVVKQRLMTRKGKESRLETLLPKEPWQLIRSHSLMKEVEKQISALSRQNQMKVVPIDNSRPGMPRDALRRLVEEVVQLYNAFAP